jgi:hypothetical protein
VIFSRLLAVLIAAVALVACLGVVAFSLVFALWALLAPSIGGAGATAVVIAAFAASIAMGGGLAVMALTPKAREVAPPALTLDAALGFVRERPVATVVGAVGAVAVIVMQPRLAFAVVRNLMRRNRPARAGA